MLFFIHVPKAAGTSLRDTLAAGLGERLVWIYQTHPGHTARDALSRELPSEAVLYGHFSHGLHRQFRVAENYATVLRHPVSRVVSWYNFQGSQRGLPFYAQARALPLSEFLKRDLTEEVSNHMTKIMAGRRPRALDDEETLAKAMKNLSNFVFVSTQEHIEADLPELGRLLGVTLPSMGRVNVTSRKTADDAGHDDILKYNMLDLKLYEHALSLREQMLTRADANGG